MKNEKNITFTQHPLSFCLNFHDEFNFFDRDKKFDFDIAQCVFLKNILWGYL